MKTIIAIGGQHIPKHNRPLKPNALDRELLRLSSKKRPHVLFVPTASSDDPIYCRNFIQHFGKRLRCEIDLLLLLNKNISQSLIKRKMAWADIIYVGGGNTLMMMRRWRHLDFDKRLRKAWNQGKVLCGISAGSICWFESGHSDSISYYGKKDWDYICVKGLGFLKGIHCPHYNGHTAGQWRRKDFARFMKQHRGIGIAIDNFCAIGFYGDNYQVIPFREGAKAFRVLWQRGHIREEPLIQSRKTRPVKDLLNRQLDLREGFLFD